VLGSAGSIREDGVARAATPESERQQVRGWAELANVGKIPLTVCLRQIFGTIRVVLLPEAGTRRP
jgi:hypothetical protein